MRTEAFHQWLSQADALTAAQRRRAVEILRQERKLPDPLAGILAVEPACPRCHHQPCGRWGNAHGLPRYRCSACGKTFNVLSGTPLARLRHRECWDEYARALIDGDTVRAAARRCAQEHRLPLAPPLSHPSGGPQAIEPARHRRSR